MSKATWKTKEGKSIKIKDMTNSHLLNTIKFIKKVAEQQQYDELDAAYSAAFSFSEDSMASYYADQDIDKMESISLDQYIQNHYPAFETIIEEAKKRKLIY